MRWVSELEWREGGLGWVGLTGQADGLRHNPTQRAETATNTRAQRQRDNTDAPDAVTLSPGARASLAMEPHGTQARQMEIHVGQTGRELRQKPWQTEPSGP